MPMIRKSAKTPAALRVRMLEISVRENCVGFAGSGVLVGIKVGGPGSVGSGVEDGGGSSLNVAVRSIVGTGVDVGIGVGVLVSTRL